VASGSILCRATTKGIVGVRLFGSEGGEDCSQSQALKLAGLWITRTDPALGDARPVLERAARSRLEQPRCRLKQRSRGSQERSPSIHHKGGPGSGLIRASSGSTPRSGLEHS